MTAIDGALEKVGNDPVRKTGSLLSLLPSVALHAAVAAAIWLGFATRPDAIQPPVTLISLAPAVAPTPPAPLPVPPSGLRLPQAAPPVAETPPLDFAPPPLPEPDSFPFDADATREAPPPEPEAKPIEKAEEKPKPPPEKPKKAKAKPGAKPKPKDQAKKPAAPKPAPTPVPTASKAAENPAPAATTASTKSAPAAPAATATQNAAISDAAVRVTDPNYAGACPISYPERARRRNQEGMVVIHALIGTDGKPIEVSVSQSSGHRLLDEAAQEAIADCAFVPQKVGGRAVRAIVEIPIPFKLI